MKSKKRERPTPEEVGQAVGIYTNKVPQDNLLSKAYLVKGGMK